MHRSLGGLPVHQKEMHRADKLHEDNIVLTAIYLGHVCVKGNLWQVNPH